MTLNELIQRLVALKEKSPENGDLLVLAAGDDEGNSFRRDLDLFRGVLVGDEVWSHQDYENEFGGSGGEEVVVLW